MKHYILIRNNKIIKAGRYENVEKEVFEKYDGLDRTKDHWLNILGEGNEVLFLFTE